nr:immunoglobulin heavy chain junction region [Macaca mulatta]MOV51070.1 immunoglobulin heavy chain junction region [Macaca mulatta]MOV51603.1 immunoglobulin heavy chain junction region [Macaca mulatta]MOV52094.1 immunoglobulin heavy chain junction region [Macaca mulatta]MOV52572.1 immunoglobulin heavy chain junction region [Macaca mulatta]
CARYGYGNNYDYW